jgi:hypothetical protein
MKYFFAALLLVGITDVSAQKDSVQQKPKIRLDYISSLNISPFAIADIDNNIMVGGEYRFQHNLSVSLDVAYIFFSNYYAESKKSHGFNVRPSFRYYYGKREHEFLQLQLFYKHVDYNMYGWVGKDCVNDVPTYNQLQDFIIKKNVKGINILVGELLPLSEKMYIDMAIGLGVRFKDQKIASGGDCIPSQTRSMVNRFDETVTSVSLPFAIKFAYILK